MITWDLDLQARDRQLFWHLRAEFDFQFNKRAACMYKYIDNSNK